MFIIYIEFKDFLFKVLVFGLEKRLYYARVLMSVDNLAFYINYCNLTLNISLNPTSLLTNNLHHEQIYVKDLPHEVEVQINLSEKHKLL